ncbi:MAG: hypothetical protein ACRC62_18420 [Microcoleus sp.]
MGKLLVKLGNAENWRDFYNNDWKAQISTSNGKWDRIPKQKLPVLAEHRILAVASASVDAKPHWRTGGWLVAQLNLPATVSFKPEVATLKVPLFKHALWVLPDYGHSYELEFTPAPWLRTVEIAIEEYIGEEKDSTEEVIKTLPSGEWVTFN